MKRIYQIKNRVTGDCYIGSAVDIIDRLKYHRKALEQNLYLTSKDRKPYLQNAWNKYREEALEFSILEELPEHWEEGQELSYDLIEVEQEWIDFLKPAYNTSSIAGRPPHWFDHSLEDQIGIRRKLSSAWTNEKREEQAKVSRERALEINLNRKGRTYEEIYGEERAREIKLKQSSPRGPTPPFRSR